MSLTSKKNKSSDKLSVPKKKSSEGKKKSLQLSVLPPVVPSISHFRACKRGIAHFDGIDVHGKNKVLPPTFEGIKNLVKRVGEDFAKAQFATEPESPEANLPKDTLREFLNELQFADNVERQTLIREFSEYVNDLEEQITSQSSAPGAVAEGTQRPTEGEPLQGEPPVEQ